MTMIEQIARASHEFFRPIYKLPPFDELPEDAKSTMFQHAKAILEWLPEELPMPLYDAAKHYCYEDTDPDKVWAAVIKAALAEKPA